LNELIALNSISSQAANFLDASVTAGLNILLSSGTQAGRRRALCAAIPARERTVTVGQVFDLA
jgi:pilus assembly protein CpaF